MGWFWKSDFERFLEDFEAGEVPALLKSLQGIKIEKASEARAVVKRVRSAPRHQTSKGLRRVVSLFKDAASPEAFRIFSDGIPILLAIQDGLSKGRAGQSEEDRDLELALFHIFAAYHSREGSKRIREALQSGLAPGEVMWERIFESCDPDDPALADVFASPTRTILDRATQVRLLGAMNELARNDKLRHHPFDSAEGIETLRLWLSEKSKGSDAFYAAASLSFLRGPGRDSLIEAALAHEDGEVRREAAWSAARLRSEAGIRHLVEMAKDVHQSRVACKYLKEVGLSDRIPPEVRDPDFRAMASFSRWLQHPNELGETPASLELYDTRKIYWPPTKDRRQLWLFRYVCHGSSPGDEKGSGVGLHGSETWCMFDGSTNYNMSPEDVYAVHCAWEIHSSQHDGMPGKRTLEEARALWRKLTAEEPATPPRPSSP